MVRLVSSAARRCSACTTVSLRAASRASRTCASVSGGGCRDGGGAPQPSLQYEALAAAPRALTATLVRPPPPPPCLEPPPLTEAQVREALRSRSSSLHLPYISP